MSMHGLKKSMYTFQRIFDLILLTFEIFQLHVQRLIQE